MRLTDLNLGLRFLLELSALAALAYWGSQTGSLPVAITLAVVTPLAGAVLWGLFVAPKAPRRLHGARRLLVEVPFFAAATAGLAATGEWLLAVIFAGATAVSEVITYGWSGDEGEANP
jgi:hypothetical protein